MPTPAEMLLDQIEALSTDLEGQERRGRDRIEPILEQGEALDPDLQLRVDNWVRKCERYQALVELAAAAGLVERYQSKLVPEDRVRAMLDPGSN